MLSVGGLLYVLLLHSGTDTYKTTPLSYAHYSFSTPNPTYFPSCFFFFPFFWLSFLSSLSSILQYGGVHWSKNKELYLKHLDEYKKCTATIFKECNLFVIWGMIVAKDYDGLTDHYVQLDDDPAQHLSKPALAQLLKERLQCTTWSY